MTLNGPNAGQDLIVKRSGYIHRIFPWMKVSSKIMCNYRSFQDVNFLACSHFWFKEASMPQDLGCCSMKLKILTICKGICQEVGVPHPPGTVQYRGSLGSSPTWFCRAHKEGFSGEERCWSSSSDPTQPPELLLLPQDDLCIWRQTVQWHRSWNTSWCRAYSSGSNRCRLRKSACQMSTPGM